MIGTVSSQRNETGVLFKTEIQRREQKELGGAGGWEGGPAFS